MTQQDIKNLMTSLFPKMLRDNLMSFSNLVVPQHKHNGVDSPLINYTNRLGIGDTTFTQEFGVKGDAYISGKLTVVGAIDPTSVTLSDPLNAAYYEGSNGINAAVSPSNTGRLRYNASTQKWQMSMNGAAYVDIGTGTGAGTVTSFSSGDLSPLFTTSVANPTTTPALSFNLSNAGANTYLGNPTGGSAAPAYTSAGALTKVDDTNVTLTLGGSPTTSLLASTSLTLGWNGTLGIARGGTASTQGNIVSILCMATSSGTLADGAVIYFGAVQTGQIPSTTSTFRKISFAFTGTLVAADISVTPTNVGVSNEPSTLDFQNITAGSFSTISNAVVFPATSVNQSLSVTGLSIPITAGEEYNLRFTGATWATNPSSIFFTVMLYFRV